MYSSHSSTCPFMTHSTMHLKQGRHSTWGPLPVTAWSNFVPTTLLPLSIIMSECFHNTLWRPWLIFLFKYCKCLRVHNYNSTRWSQVIGQSLESWVGAKFKPLAYAVILLRPEGYPYVQHVQTLNYYWRRLGLAASSTTIYLNRTPLKLLRCFESSYSRGNIWLMDQWDTVLRTAITWHGLETEMMPILMVV